MKLSRTIYLLLAAVLVLTSCEHEFSPENTPRAQINFAIRTLQGEVDEVPSTRGNIGKDSLKSIKELHYVVLDYNQQIINPQWQTLAPDFSFLALEGLADGDYSIAFFATTSEDATIPKPTIKGGKLVLENPSEDSPLNIDYLFSRIRFTVDKGNHSQTIDVNLSRTVGCVKVEINSTVPYSTYLIQKVEFSLSSDSELYLSQTSDSNGYAGSGTINALDLTTERDFYSLPSKAPLSGVVTIESLRKDGKTVKNNYKFSNVNIEAGKISRIQIDWTSSESSQGLFHVRESDYTPDNTQTMFLDSEPQGVFYNASLRSFRSNEPLQIRITGDKKLQLKYYSPIPLHDVTILCRFRKYSNEFFPFANYQIIKAFSDSKMEIPLVSKALTFTTADGRNILIPAQSNLKSEDCEFKIVSTSPYMAKIATIKYPLSISFSPYSAGSPGSNWRHMTPALCRHACVLVANLSFLFSSKEFEDKVNGWPGSSSSSENANPLTNSAGQIIPPATVIAQARARSLLYLGAVGGVGGLGGGSTYGLAPYCYTEQYWDTGGQFTFSREAIFHEFAHCMGYNHSGTMTYGDAWTRLCQELVRELGSKGKLPVSNANWVSNYPNESN